MSVASPPPSKEPSKEFGVWLGALAKKSYYAILNVPKEAPGSAIKQAFHDFAIRYHPDQYVEGELATVALAAEVFKRGVEAYQVLNSPRLRAAYDAGLAKGKLRYTEGERTEKAPLRTRTLEQIAKTPRAKQFAKKADRLLSGGQLDDARVALVTALQDDHDNDELKERLSLLYEAMSLGPL